MSPRDEIKKQLEGILKDNSDDTWQTRSIRALALAMIQLINDVENVCAKIDYLKSFFLYFVIAIAISLVLLVLRAYL